MWNSWPVSPEQEFRNKKFVNTNLKNVQIGIFMLKYLWELSDRINEMFYGFLSGR